MMPIAQIMNDFNAGASVSRLCRVYHIEPDQLLRMIDQWRQDGWAFKPMISSEETTAGRIRQSEEWCP